MILNRPRPYHPLGLPQPGFTPAVGLCLGVVMREECEHRRYAVRDLATLEADPGAGAAHDPNSAR